jgi:hypothetical protein
MLLSSKCCSNRSLQWFIDRFRFHCWVVSCTCSVVFEVCILRRFVSYGHSFPSSSTRLSTNSSLTRSDITTRVRRCAFVSMKEFCANILRRRGLMLILKLFTFSIVAFAKTTIVSSITSAFLRR